MISSARGNLITLTYPTKGARKVIDAQARRLPGGFGLAMDNAAGIYRTQLERYTPIGKGETSGQLRAGWRVRKVGAGGKASRVVYNKQKYLKFVLKGRGAIDQIQSGRRRWDAQAKVWRGALRFVIRGRVLYRWRVGPARANPFHIRAARAARSMVRQQFHGDVQAIFARTNQL